MRLLWVLPVCLLVAGLGYTFSFASSGEQDGVAAVQQRLRLANQMSPVLDRDFPDPFVLSQDGTFYAFATNSAGRNISTARSVDLVSWEMLPDAMAELAPWVRPVTGQVWAPEVIALGGEFRMYYTARDAASNRQCIGVASSEHPEGPYRDLSARPLLCPDGYQFAIDPNPFLDRGQLYLYFSGVCCGGSTSVLAVTMAPDGLSVLGAPVTLLKVDQLWEGNTVEAPTLLKRGSDYYLFYSGNDYRNETYGVGYATCKRPLGPCVKATSNPVLSSEDGATGALGPGHQSITKVGDEYWLIFHGWKGALGYRQGGSRVMWLAPLEWKEGKPTVPVAAQLKAP